jgi:hypothetical protein
MNMNLVREWIKKIDKLDASGDFEESHQEEDSLVWEFVRHVADPNNFDFADNNAIASALVDWLEETEAQRYFS